MLRRLGDRLGPAAGDFLLRHQQDCPGSGFRRITARLNLSYDFAKWLTVGFKGSYTFRDENPNRATIGGANIWDGAVYLAPTMGPKDYINPLYENGVRIDTPRAKIDCNENESERMTNTDVLEFTIKPVRGLIIKSQNSYMVYQLSLIHI